MHPSKGLTCICAPLTPDLVAKFATLRSSIRSPCPVQGSSLVHSACHSLVYSPRAQSRAALWSTLLATLWSTLPVPSPGQLSGPLCLPLSGPLFPCRAQSKAALWSTLLANHFTLADLVLTSFFIVSMSIIATTLFKQYYVHHFIIIMFYSFCLKFSLCRPAKPANNYLNVYFFMSYPYAVS